MIPITIALVVGIAAGVIIAIVGKFNMSGNWSNKEFDGTMFIAIILLAFCGSVLGTYLNPEFAQLTTTEKLFDIFENVFMIIVGYLFKKAVDAAGDGK